MDLPQIPLIEGNVYPLHDPLKVDGHLSGEGGVPGLTAQGGAATADANQDAAILPQLRRKVCT